METQTNNDKGHTMTKINIRVESVIEIILDGHIIGSGWSIKSAYEDAVKNCPKSWSNEKVEEHIGKAYLNLAQCSTNILVDRE